MENNLKSASEIGKYYHTSIETFDNLGNSHIIKTTFTKTFNNKWEIKMSLDPSIPMIKDWLADNSPDFDSLSDKGKNKKSEESNGTEVNILANPLTLIYQMRLQIC